MIEVTFWITGARYNYVQFGQLDKHTRLTESTQYTKAKKHHPLDGVFLFWESIV